jgi:hypothetical protein
MAFGHESSLVDELNWGSDLSDLSICCADDDAGATPVRVRELNALLRSMPIAARAHGVHPVGLSRLEDLLELGACENAVLSMLGLGPSFMVSRSSDGGSFATVVLPGLHGEQSCSGATPALALIGALASALASGHVAVDLSGSQASCDARVALH